MTCRSLLHFCLVLICTTGCVPIWQGRNMEADITTLRAQLNATKKGIDADRDALQKAINQAQTKALEVEQALDKFNKSSTRNDNDLGLQLDKLTQSMQEMSGRLEDAQFRLDRMDKMAKEAEAQEKTAATTGQATPSKPLLPGNQAQAVQLVTKLLIANSEDDRDEGKRLAKEFLVKWPKQEGASDVVHIALADRLAEEKTYQKAVVEYKKVLDDVPKSRRADEAMFKIGKTFMMMGYHEDAKVFFEELVRRYPKSTFVKDAKEKLLELEKLEKSKKRPSKVKGR